MAKARLAAVTLTTLLAAASLEAQWFGAFRYAEYFKPAPCTKAEAEQAKLVLKDPTRLREVYDETIGGAWWYDPDAIPVVDELLSCARYHDVIAGNREGYQEFLRRAAYVNFHAPLYDPREQQPPVVASILKQVDPDDEYFKKYLFQAAQHYQQSIDDYAAREGWGAFSASWLVAHPPESADIVTACLSKIEDKAWLEHYVKVVAATLGKHTLLLAGEKVEIAHPELEGTIYFIMNDGLDRAFGEAEGARIREEFFALRQRPAGRR